MKIIIVGCGNVGATLAASLDTEGHEITIIDKKEALVRDLSNALDVLGITGNGASYNLLVEAGASQADLLIAVTSSDELNLLCCLVAKMAGAGHTIARVSNPVYGREIEYIKEQLGLSMIVNPQQAAARRIARILKFPSALKVDSFAKSKAELVVHRLEENNPLCGMRLKELGVSKYRAEILIPIVQRGDQVEIPDGNFQLQAKDEICVIGTTANNIAFFKKLGIPTAAVKDAIIVGGGRTGIYLANSLIETGIKVKIIEKNEKRCEELSELLPKAMIIHGDATDKDVLIEEGLQQTEAFLSMTNIDEENIMLSLYAKSLSKAKLITKVHRVAYDEIIDSLDVGSVIYPKYIAAESIVKYVRAMDKSFDSNIETLYQLSDNRVEVLEFVVKKDSAVIGIPLQDINFKPNVLVGCVSHKGKAVIPNGQSVIQEGDTIIVVTTVQGIRDLADALA